MSYPYNRPGRRAGHEDLARQAAFEQYDPLVSAVLNDLRAALFPEAYTVTRVKLGKWYISPPPHTMQVHPVVVELCFDDHHRPVGFQICCYVAWTTPVNCGLSPSSLRAALQKLFPAFTGPPDDDPAQPVDRCPIDKWFEWAG